MLAIKEFRGRFLRGISTHGKGHEFRPYLGFAKIVKEISAPSVKLLPDYYCLLAFAFQDLSRNIATMGYTLHFSPFFCKAFVDTLHGTAGE